MLKPDEAVRYRPNIDSMMYTLEKYTDEILALEVSNNAPQIDIMYFGAHYSMMKTLVRAFIHTYSSYWDVEDITGNRKYMYVLSFRMKHE